jgi:hypothetical protein
MSYMPKDSTKNPHLCTGSPQLQHGSLGTQLPFVRPLVFLYVTQLLSQHIRERIRDAQAFQESVLATDLSIAPMPSAITHVALVQLDVLEPAVVALIVE